MNFVLEKKIDFYIVKFLSIDLLLFKKKKTFQSEKNMIITFIFLNDQYLNFLVKFLNIDLLFFFLKK